jgi:DNA-binding NarL/FixJ family response regulator
MASRSIYYEKAQLAVNEYEFASERDRQLWELHASGLTVREIAKQTGISKSAVDRTVQRLKLIIFGSSNED